MRRKSQVRILFFRKLLSKFELRRFSKSREIFKKQVKFLPFKGRLGGVFSFLPPLTPPARGRTRRAGFALIEVIVSMVILSLVLAAAVGLLYSVSNAVEANRNRLTATYLAQECLELVRNARDTAWRNHQPWDCAWTGDSCPDNIKEILSKIGQDPVIVNGKVTKFSREFIIGESVMDEVEINGTSIERAIETAITCKVSWDEHSLSISEILTNWRKR